jgi:uncharacterized protein (TIGR02246 family)
MRTIVGSGILLLLSLAPCLAQETARDIGEANERFMEAFNKGDAAALGRMYAEKAVVLPPEAPIVEGREAIEKFWDGAVKGGFKNLSLTAVRVDELGDEAAREIGRFGLDAPGRDGGLQRVEGKYVVVWIKAGGEWQLDTDIWNTDRPAAPEVATGSSAPAAAGSGTSR